MQKTWMIGLALFMSCGQAGTQGQGPSLFVTRNADVLTHRSGDQPDVQEADVQALIEHGALRHVDFAAMESPSIEPEDQLPAENASAVTDAEKKPKWPLLYYFLAFLKKIKVPASHPSNFVAQTEPLSTPIPSPSVEGPKEMEQSPKPALVSVKQEVVDQVPVAEKEVKGSEEQTVKPSPSGPASLSIQSKHPWGTKTLPLKYDFKDMSDVPYLPQSPQSPTKDSAYLYMSTSKSTIKALTSILWVPEKPEPGKGTLFLWPGIQPAGPSASGNPANILPIDIGVLQPVLTWGPTCAPGAPEEPYAEWWISGQYVNTIGKHPGFMGCKGGPGLLARNQDPLLLKIEAISGKSSLWQQTVFNFRTQKTVTYTIDLRGQDQQQVIFSIEPYHGARPRKRVYFSDILLELHTPDPAACKVDSKGPFDRHTVPLGSQNGKFCYIEKLSLALEK